MLKSKVNGFGSVHTQKAEVRRMADQKQAVVPWLWPGRVSMGAITLIAGDPGLGKSMMTLDLAARVSSGLPFPGEPGTIRRERSGVLLLSGEDDIRSTILPRLSAMGADLTRIACVNTVKRYDERTSREEEYALILERDMEALRAAMASVEPCRLVVIDPITSFLGRVSVMDSQGVRNLLQRMLNTLRGPMPAVVIVAHLNKTRKRSALGGIAGAMAFAAVARTAWMVMKDPADRTGARRLMLPVKNNLGLTRGLAFTVTGGAGEQAGEQAGACVAWEEGEVSMSADEGMSPESDGLMMERHARAEAKVWLEGVLRGGPMSAKEVYLKAGREGISRKTLERAKLELGVVGKRAGFQGPWSWFAVGQELKVNLVEAELEARSNAAFASIRAQGI